MVDVCFSQSSDYEKKNWEKLIFTVIIQIHTKELVLIAVYRYILSIKGIFMLCHPIKYNEIKIVLLVA